MKKREKKKITKQQHMYTDSLKHDQKNTRAAATNKLRNLQTAGTQKQRRHQEITETTMNRKKERERSITTHRTKRKESENIQQEIPQKKKTR